MPPPDRHPAAPDEAREAQTQDHQDDTTSLLLLSRTKTPEINVAETTVLQIDDGVPAAPQDRKPDPADPAAAPPPWSRATTYLILLCAFLTSLSFGVTQVPLLYVFRLMTCDVYYGDHASQSVALAHAARADAPSSTTTTTMTSAMLAYALSPLLLSSSAFAETPSTADRCSLRSIEASTALSIALLSASTTVFGLINLFIASNLIKRLGVKPTLLIQIFFPALRLLVQVVGVEVWGSAGIIIVQCSQVVSILGGPIGYLLVLNTFVTEVVEYEGRTTALGRLAGAMMAGSAIGFLVGGLVAEAFGIKAPFRLAGAMFLLSCVYSAVALPHIAPTKGRAGGVGVGEGKEKKSGVFQTYFGPLAVFAPRKFIGKDGVVRIEYGALLLAWGVFLGILATGYLPTLLQLYSTDVFSFGTTENGWLIFMYSMLRGLFLTFAFPKFIAMGRKWTLKREEQARQSANGGASGPSEREPLLAAQNNHSSAQKDHGNQDGSHKKEQTFRFDLTYTRFSLLADGLLTLLCSFVHEGWQMYLVAAILPFSAGTGSAAKGTILQMVGSSASTSERTDALAGVSLVENMARLTTTFAFGVIFAGFAKIGRQELVFTCNAAVALIGFVVLLFARFPLEGSRPLDKENEAENPS